MGSGAQSLGEDPSQGAKRGEAAPLTARTDLESLEVRERGCHTSTFLPFVSAPALGLFQAFPQG